MDKQGLTVYAKHGKLVLWSTVMVVYRLLQGIHMHQLAMHIVTIKMKSKHKSHTYVTYVRMYVCIVCTYVCTYIQDTHVGTVLCNI